MIHVPLRPIGPVGAFAGHAIVRLLGSGGMDEVHPEAVARVETWQGYLRGGGTVEASAATDSTRH